MNQQSIKYVSVALALLLSAPSVDAADCKDLTYGSPRYAQRMDELAAQAKLPDGSWNRYHESFVAALCGAKTVEMYKLVDSGSVSADEAEQIATALDKTYRPRRIAKISNKVASSKAKLIEMGVCAACADNIAQYYSRKPRSRCAKLAQRALSGDAAAASKLINFPAECRWAY
jgi:hypothetical protein